MSEEIDQYTRIIEHPHSSDEEKARAYIQRGHTCRSQERYDLAIEAYGQAIDLFTNDNGKAQAYNSRGHAYKEQKKYEEAIADYGQAIDLFTNNEYKAGAYIRRGNVYKEQGKYDLAIEDYRRAIKLFTNNEDKARAYNSRGHTSRSQGKYEEAIKDYGQAINLYTNDDDKARMYLWRGDTYSQQGKYDLAIKDYESALSLNPKLKEASLHKLIAESKKETEKTEIVRKEVQSFSGKAHSVGLAEEYEKERERLWKSRRIWTIFFIGGIVLLMLAPILSMLLSKHISEIIGNPPILIRMLSSVSLIAPLLWLTSFFAKRRSETNMLLQEYTHKTIFAKSYIAYKETLEKLENKDPELLHKLLSATIDTLKRSPEYIFRKKHSNDMPIEELQKFAKLFQNCKEIFSLSPKQENKD